MDSGLITPPGTPSPVRPSISANKQVAKLGRGVYGGHRASSFLSLPMTPQGTPVSGVSSYDYVGTRDTPTRDPEVLFPDSDAGIDSNDQQADKSKIEQNPPLEPSVRFTVCRLEEIFELQEMKCGSDTKTTGRPCRRDIPNRRGMGEQLNSMAELNWSSSSRVANELKKLAELVHCHDHGPKNKVNTPVDRVKERVGKWAAQLSVMEGLHISLLALEEDAVEVSAPPTESATITHLVIPPKAFTPVVCSEEAIRSLDGEGSANKPIGCHVVVETRRPGPDEVVASKHHNKHLGDGEILDSAKTINRINELLSDYDKNGGDEAMEEIKYRIKTLELDRLGDKYGQYSKQAGARVEGGAEIRCEHGPESGAHQNIPQEGDKQKTASRGMAARLRSQFKRIVSRST